MGAQPQAASKLAEFLSEIAEGAEFPALSRSIEQVMLKVDEEPSLQHVTNIILKDFSLTLKILRTANSAIYNRSGRPVISISRAVTLLGLDTVREMAAGAALLEHFRKHSPGLKELMLLSLLSANHARETSCIVEYPRAEEAYLCGMFRNLGELLIACYRPREYAAILLRLHEDRIPIALACNEILGFTYEDCGRAVAARWHMPENVRDCMSDRVLRLRRPPCCDAERLEMIAHFAHKLTNAVYRREPNVARASVNLLLSSLGPVLGVTHDSVRHIVEKSLQETSEMFLAMSLQIDRLRLNAQTVAALAQVDELPIFVHTPAPVAEPDVLQRLVRDVTLEVDRGSQDLGAITMMVMEGLYRGGPFERVVFALVDPTEHRLIGQIGLGEAIDKVIEKFNFPIVAAAGPVARAVLKRTDVFVEGARDRRYEGTRHAQMQGGQVFGGMTYGLFPIVVEDKVIACLYFDRSPGNEASRKPLDAAAFAGFAALRDQLCRALARSRSGNILTAPHQVR